MQALVYLVLGCPNSGRRETLCDLMEDLAKPDDPFSLLIADSEEPSEWDAKLAALPHVTVVTYNGGVANIAPGKITPEPTTIILSPGNSNPVDEVEALKPLLESTNAELGRIITVAHCGLVEEHPNLKAWYDACIHFSDVCVINRSPETSNQVVQDFVDRYKGNHFPCLLEATRKGRVKNPGLILEPQARRISLYFDPDEDSWVDEDEELEEESQEDPYLAKLPSGVRVKRIPDIQTIFVKP